MAFTSHPTRLSTPTRPFSWANSFTSALNIGSSYTETQSVTLPYGISGNYYLLVFVDDNRYAGYQGPGAVLEYQDEGNNITALPMQVLPTSLPDLQVTAVTAPGAGYRESNARRLMDRHQHQPGTDPSRTDDLE